MGSAFYVLFSFTGNLKISITIIATFVHSAANNSVIESFLRSINLYYPGMKVIVGVPMNGSSISTKRITDVQVKRFPSQ